MPGYKYDKVASNDYEDEDEDEDEEDIGPVFHDRFEPGASRRNTEIDPNDENKSSPQQVQKELAIIECRLATFINKADAKGVSRITTVKYLMRLGVSTKRIIEECVKYYGQGIKQQLINEIHLFQSATM